MYLIAYVQSIKLSSQFDEYAKVRLRQRRQRTGISGDHPAVGEQIVGDGAAGRLGQRARLGHVLARGGAHVGQFSARARGDELMTLSIPDGMRSLSRCISLQCTINT